MATGKRNRLKVSSLIRRNPAADAKLIAEARAQIRILRKQGIEPRAYDVRDRRTGSKFMLRDSADAAI
jgi:hypothetical protein